MSVKTSIRRQKRRFGLTIQTLLIIVMTLSLFLGRVVQEELWGHH
jgi:hypothetical protein